MSDSRPQTPEKNATAKPNAPAASESAGRRIIKKYPNRRLYDMALSSYVTVVELRDLVLDGTDFVVQDGKTGEDLTRGILLQIILEQETGGTPMFSEAVLTQMIRFYGHATQGYMGVWLEQNTALLSQMQSKMIENAQWMPAGPTTALQDAMGRYAEQSNAMFSQWQEQMVRQTEQILDAFGLRQ